MDEERSEGMLGIMTERDPSETSFDFKTSLLLPAKRGIQAGLVMAVISLIIPSTYTSVANDSTLLKNLKRKSALDFRISALTLAASAQKISGSNVLIVLEVRA